MKIPKLLTVIVLTFFIGGMGLGCSTPLTTREKGAGIGVLGGAAVGAIIGKQVGKGHPAAGALIGGVLGLGAGALIGDQLGDRDAELERQRRELEDQRRELERQRRGA